MRAALTIVGSGSKSLSYFLGAAIIVGAIVAALTQLGVKDIADLAFKMFGPTFLVITAALTLTVVFSWVRMTDPDQTRSERIIWLETGSHAASGVATVALTYTLLGISLGIGTLSDQPLTPDTVQVVIQGLTKHFSVAFMTTVVGLPVSALLRAFMFITAVKLEGGDAESETKSYEGEIQ